MSLDPTDDIDGTEHLTWRQSLVGFLLFVALVIAPMFLGITCGR